MWFKNDLDIVPRSQFAEQFKEVKEAARLAREKSQERFELANPALDIAAPEVNYFLIDWNQSYNTSWRIPISQNMEFWEMKRSGL